MSELISISEALNTDKIKLRRDLMEGKINLDLYGLEFYAFLDKAQKGQYFHDPKQFFDRTYITSNIQILIEAIYSRALGDKSENPAHLLDTTFGGGKTHTLICLHHFFSNFFIFLLCI